MFEYQTAYKKSPWRLSNFQTLCLQPARSVSCGVRQTIVANSSRTATETSTTALQLLPGSRRPQEAHRKRERERVRGRPLSLQPKPWLPGIPLGTLRCLLNKPTAMSFYPRPHAGRVVTLFRLPNPHAHPLQWDAVLRPPCTEGMDSLRDSPLRLTSKGRTVRVAACWLGGLRGRRRCVHVRGGDKPGVIRYTLSRARRAGGLVIVVAKAAHWHILSEENTYIYI